MAATSRFSILLCLCLPAWGCGLIPVPYVADVTGPVRGIRVLDVRSGEDIPTATASIESGMGMSGANGPAAPQLFAAIPEAGREKPQKPSATPGLTRGKDQTFAVPRCVVTGMIPHGYVRENPPTATIDVAAPGYVRATLEYCVGEAPQAGWSQSRSRLKEWAAPGGDAASSAVDPQDADGSDDLVRCEFRADGILRFFLRRVEPAEAAGSRQRAVGSG